MNRYNHQAFSRSKAIFAAISAALSAGVTMTNALMLAKADQYQSRGKGRNKSNGKTTRQNFYRSFNHYPFSSARQDARGARQYSKLMPNGHVVMQTVSRKDYEWSNHANSFPSFTNETN